jgi:hypothetical protein
MSNENNYSKKLVLGVALGAVIGIGVFCVIKAAQNHKTPILHKIGKVISEVGAELENSKIESFSDVTREIQNALPSKGDLWSGVLNWISSGVSLLQNLKK